MLGAGGGAETGATGAGAATTGAVGTGARTSLSEAERHLAPNPVAPTAEPEVTADRIALSALEWLVVSLARRDRLSSLREPGRISVAMGAVFGSGRRNPRLADPKLEALRRMAVFGWHRGFAVPVHEERAFLNAGFSSAQYETLLTSIGRGRLASTRTRAA